MSNERLTVSVIIPTYNRRALVTLAIDSVLQQSRLPDEILVVDDGSTDGTAEALARYGAPVRVIRQPNRGRSAARNTGLAAARTDAVIFLDSDDLLMPRCIEQCVQILEQQPDVDIVYSDAYVMDANGRLGSRYSQVMRGHRPSGMVFGELARRCFLTVTSMVRRSCLTGVTFEEGLAYCEDYDFWRILAARCKFQYLDEPLMAYRFHEGMSVASQHRKTLEKETEVRDRFLAMPEFSRLSRRERARIYCTHGIKHAMLDRTDVARRYFVKAVRTCPTYLAGPALTMVSLLGTNLLKSAIVKRRQLAGHKLGLHGGPLSAVDHAEHPSCQLTA